MDAAPRLGSQLGAHLFNCTRSATLTETAPWACKRLGSELRQIGTELDVLGGLRDRPAVGCD
jgi:hypothetical protein